MLRALGSGRAFRCGRSTATRRALAVVTAALLFCALQQRARAAQSTEELAKETQNPVAN